MGQERGRLLLSRIHLIVLGFTFGADSISEEVAGFSNFLLVDQNHLVNLVGNIMNAVT